MQLSIIIVNYNVKYFTEQCLCSVANAVKNIAAEVIVVDNSSTDGSHNYLNNKFANVHFIWNTENEGFSKANNLALKIASGKYILFLNPDTIIAENCFEKCIAFFESKNDAGGLGVRMIDGAGNYLRESKRGFPSPRTSFFKLSGLAAMFPASPIFARYYLGQLPEHENNCVDVLAGAFMMVKKVVLAITGGFDETFFMYGEDIDLSYRIQKAGYKNYYFAGTTIVHFKGESTQRNTFRHIKIFYGAMIFFVKKHYGKTEALLYRILIQLAIGVKGTGSVIKKLFSARPRIDANATTPSLITLVVANEKDTGTIIQLIRSIGAQATIAGRIAPAMQASTNALGNIAQLPEQIKQYRVQQVIFCLNELSASEMMDVIQQLPPGVAYSFHYAGSSSIVGSTDKNRRGNVIAKPSL